MISPLFASRRAVPCSGSAVVAVLGAASLAVFAAPSARAQSTITLTAVFNSASAAAANGTFTQGASTLSNLTLTSGAALTNQSLGTLTYSASTLGDSSATLLRNVSFSVDGAAATTETLSYGVTGNRFIINLGPGGTIPITTIAYSSASQTYTLSNGGTLQVSTPGTPPTNSGNDPSSSVTVTATLLYTAATSVAAAPEPGSIALLLTAGIPALGLVRRRKQH